MTGIEKFTALKVLKRFSLKKLGNLNSEKNKIMVEANKFVAMCYGKKDSTDMSEIRLVLVDPIKMRVS